MRRQVTAALGTLAAIGLMLVATVAPAAARTTGKQSFRGLIVASGESGTRTVGRHPDRRQRRLHG